MNKQPKDDSITGLGGVLSAIEKLAKLADELQNAQGALNREGEVDLGKHAKASYHLRVRTLGDMKREIRRESSKSDFKPFEKSAPLRATQTTSTHLPKRTVVEPETDLFVENDAVVIYAQLSGVCESDIFIDANVDRLMLRAESSSFLYQKDLTLPVRIQPQSLVKSYKNGILEVRLLTQSNT